MDFKPPGSRAINAAELIYGELDVHQKVYIDPVIKSHRLNFIFAGDGVGKTYLSLKLAHALACGGMFLRWKVKNTGNVIYFDGEMERLDLKPRLTAIHKGAGVKLNEAAMQFILKDQFEKGMPNLANPKHQEYYNKEIEGHMADIVIIDNLQSCSYRGEKQGFEAQWVSIRNWAYSHKAKGRVVILVDHVSKKGEIEGSQMKRNGADLMWELKKPMINPKGNEYDGAFELHYSKGRQLKSSDRDPLFVTTKDEDGGTFFRAEKLVDYHISQIQYFDNKAKSIDIANSLGVTYDMAVWLKSQYELRKQGFVKEEPDVQGFNFGDDDLPPF